jgi:hypothetical protein
MREVCAVNPAASIHDAADFANVRFRKNAEALNSSQPVDLPANEIAKRCLQEIKMAVPVKGRPFFV